jgi:hypothetical protein
MCRAGASIVLRYQPTPKRQEFISRTELKLEARKVDSDYKPGSPGHKKHSNIVPDLLRLYKCG